jgi:hypothetical protein
MRVSTVNVQFFSFIDLSFNAGFLRCKPGKMPCLDGKARCERTVYCFIVGEPL